MVRKIENCVLLIAFVAALLVVNSSSSSPIQNDILEELKAELKSLRVKVDLLEARNIENEATILKQGKKILKLEENKMKSATSFIDERYVLQTDYKKANQIIHREESSLIDGQYSPELAFNNRENSTGNKGQRRSNSEDSSIRAIAPSSCRELSLLGHSLDGLYLVQNVDTNKIQTVLCNFGTSISQQVVGNVDVKTESVHFYVQRNTTFTTPSAVIPWELALLNEGGAMDLTSGIFTVPLNGIYHFQFSSLKADIADYLWVNLQVNGVPIASAGTYDGLTTGTFEGYSLTASIRLRKGDRVDLYSPVNSVLYETATHKTHFAGWLVEEDLPTVV